MGTPEIGAGLAGSRGLGPSLLESAAHAMLPCHVQLVVTACRPRRQNAARRRAIGVIESETHGVDRSRLSPAGRLGKLGSKSSPWDFLCPPVYIYR